MRTVMVLYGIGAISLLVACWADRVTSAGRSGDATRADKIVIEITCPKSLGDTCRRAADAAAAEIRKDFK